METYLISIAFLIVGSVIGGLIIWLYRNKQIQDLEIEKTKLKKEIENRDEKLQWAENAKEQLKNSFESLASKILQNNSEEYIKRAKEQIDSLFKQIKGDWDTQEQKIKKLVDPLDKSLDKMDKKVNQLEKSRQGAYEGLIEKIKNIGETQQHLEKATTDLTHALKSSQSRGKWGEIHLKNIVQMAGMTEHVDFDEQFNTEKGRPDMIIHLPQEGIIPVDSKAPMKSYLAGMQETDEEKKEHKFEMHAKSVRNHMRSLAKKAYWEQFEENVPEFVVMAIPYEGGLSVAFQKDPKLLEDAIKNKIIIVSPITLMALLKVIAYGWLQITLAENAQEIAEQGKELYERLAPFVDHIQSLGKNLRKTNLSFDKMVGSYERRLKPSVDRLKEMGAGTKELEKIDKLNLTPRQIDE